ncbi:Cdc37 N terminal kinase binding-domain-containing protein [Diplogelasinospora grovesii]|uniref:Hsp90 chaperone protein kinase-targeting subunit n=1 Tax=Diplogelasinospora grovesii TaxID=303347 RepID=A0AAN6N3D2_9PEZI|nr:Cdc37 N terminal kinase binding-domain-containing protein [Diplogelasinospora grovesii]
MPVDYSKWDALELSDDSDIEVHPNVDKRSFIRAKQNQIHLERQQRRQQIETLKYERVINDALISRISSLLSSLKARSAEAASGQRNPAEVAFQAVMEYASTVDPKDDQPPARPAGVHNSEEQLPTYTKMMATLLDQVNKALDEKKVEGGGRYEAMLAEVQEHLDKVTGLQGELRQKLEELEKVESSKITSESIHTGFDSSYVSKAKPGESKETKVELLNPSYAPSSSASNPTGVEELKDKGKGSSGGGDGEDDDDDDEVSASPAATQFAKIKSTDYRESLAFLGQHPEILTEKETDGLLVLAFNAQLEGRDDYARNCVHQALLLQYCRALGRDGVQLFFKRITAQQGHQAQDIFFKDVQETYMKIKNRAREINIERANNPGTDGVEQIQLHAVEPGTVINIKIPPKDSQDPQEQEGRRIFEEFKPEMQKALETGSLDEVNKVLGNMKVEEAEDVVGKLGEAGILSLEDEIIDATTEAGQQKLKHLEEEAAADKGGDGDDDYADDPE